MTKPTLSRPVTIHAARHDERWFPFLFRHSDGALLCYIGAGHDREFVPFFRLRSVDGGRTWVEERANAPRISWTRSFADGELFEIDAYGVQDPKDKQTYVHYAAWSNPSDPRRAVERGRARVAAPSCIPRTAGEIVKASGQPSVPWWPLFNSLHGKAEVSGSEIFIGGPIFTSGVELPDGRLIALGYIRDSVAPGAPDLWSTYSFESRDRGRAWTEIACVARSTRDNPDAAEGFNEASLALLRDGRLYAVMRGGSVMHHSWSSDAGRSWTIPAPMKLRDDPGYRIGMAWPAMTKLADGTLVLAFGRPGKHLIFDPSGTGEQWQGRVDLHAWELETQAIMGVPEAERLRGPTNLGVRYWDSSDYLSVVPVGDRELLVTYDVQAFQENWNALPVSGVRMLRVRLE